MDSKQKFISAYDAGYDAGLNGANTDNSHFSWFNKPENTKEWERGNKDGIGQLESEKQPMRKRIASTFKDKDEHYGRSGGY